MLLELFEDQFSVTHFEKMFDSLSDEFVISRIYRLPLSCSLLVDLKGFGLTLISFVDGVGLTILNEQTFVNISKGEPEDEQLFHDPLFSWFGFRGSQLLEIVKHCLKDFSFLLSLCDCQLIF
jgi:hypothetical protein